MEGTDGYKMRDSLMWEMTVASNQDILLKLLWILNKGS